MFTYLLNIKIQIRSTKSVLIVTAARSRPLWWKTARVLNNKQTKKTQAFAISNILNNTNDRKNHDRDQRDLFYFIFLPER